MASRDSGVPGSTPTVIKRHSPLNKDPVQATREALLTAAGT